MSAADIRYYVGQVLTKYLTEPTRKKSRAKIFSAQMLEARALQAQRYIRKTSTDEERRKVAFLWYEAARTRDSMVALEWERLSEKDVLVRRDVALAAYGIVRTLPWLDIEDIYFLRLGVEMICSDPLVAEILPSNKMRHYNLVHLLLCSVTMAGARYVIDISTLNSTVGGLWNSGNSDIRECLSVIFEDLNEVSPETAKILSGFIEG